MDTRSKSNAEFRTEVTDILTRHESSFDETKQDVNAMKHDLNEIKQNFSPVTSTLQGVMAELQAFRLSRQDTSRDREGNFFERGETSGSSPTTITRPDPTGWIFKAEQYFEFKGIEPTQQVQLASFHLEKLALQWYRWFTRDRGLMNWAEFTKVILKRFGPTDYDDPSEALSRLKQTTSVIAYQEVFERLSHKVDGLPENFLIGSFIAGLKDDIRIDVRVKQPKTLSETISVAHLIEERNLLQRKPSSNFRSAMPNYNHRAQPTTTVGLLGPPPMQPATQPPGNKFSGPIRRITSQEAKERREKGLCFYCDDKFAPGHRCIRPQLFMMEDILFEDCPADVDMDIESNGEEAIPEISFHALARTNHPQTFRVIGKVGNKEVTVLIDGGSTHNFIDQAVVSKLALPVIRDKVFRVTVGNKEIIECTGRCMGLLLTIQGLPIRADFYVLPVAACQAVLGVQWLETLGPIETDYKQLSMSFCHAGKSHTILGLHRPAGTTHAHFS
uniref:Retrotransposon gag domain-containing protein n=1 Tax=Populus alba TaxID=43335 RepID=A0A4U5PUR6_POPAL|nr:hypothetical protein D5086_0000182490 [Populus alba]